MGTKEPEKKLPVNVSKMKSDEIGKLTVKNWERIKFWSKRAINKTVSDIRHKREYEVVQCVEWTSPEGVLFWIFIDYRHQIPMFFPCIVSGNKDRPRFFFLQEKIDTNNVGIDLFTYHFMMRYRERTIKQKEMPMKEVLKRFLLGNVSNMCIWRDKDRPRAAFASRQGLLLAEKDKVNNRWVYTTYVSNDMLGDKQREAKALISELLDRQDRLFNGSRHYYKHEWDDLDEYINRRMDQLQPIAQEIYDSYYEDVEE